MGWDFTTPPRVFADPVDDKDLTRRSWVAARSVPAGGTAGQYLRKASGTDYDEAWSAILSTDLPGLRNRVRNAGNVSGSFTWSAQGGNIVTASAVGDLTVTGATDGVDGADLRLLILASGGNRTITFSPASTVPIYSLGRLPGTLWIPNGLVGIADFVYSTAASGWLLVNADVESTDNGEYYAVSAAAQSIGSNQTATVAFGTEVRTTALVTRNTSSPGHTFTLNRTGRWALWTSLLFTANQTGAKRGHIAQTGGGSGVPAILVGGGGHAQATSGQGNVFGGGSVPSIRLPAGTVLTVVGYVGTTGGGSADSLVSGSSSFGATFLGP